MKKRKTPNWLQMPNELMVTILQKLNPVEILNNAQLVCTNWRRIFKDPAMWKVISMPDPGDSREKYKELKDLTKQAVNRSCGELIDISIERFCTDNLLYHISRSSSKLKRLCLSKCNNISSSGLTDAVKKLPELEQLHLYYTYIYHKNIEVIGQSCPQLKSFKLIQQSTRIRIGCDNDALAIANSMPELRHLQLFGSDITDEGLQAILQNCPHLESLDVRMCFNLKLGGNLGKVCEERVKDFKHPNDSMENCGFDPRYRVYYEIDCGCMCRHSHHDDISNDVRFEDLGGSDVSEEVEFEEDEFDYSD